MDRAANSSSSRTAEVVEQVNMKQELCTFILGKKTTEMPTGHLGILTCKINSANGEIVLDNFSGPASQSKFVCVSLL